MIRFEGKAFENAPIYTVRLFGSNTVNTIVKWKIKNKAFVKWGIKKIKIHAEYQYNFKMYKVMLSIDIRVLNHSFA